MDEDIAVADQTSVAPPAEPRRSMRSRLGRAPSSATVLAMLIAILVAAVLAESVLLFRGNSDARVRAQVLQTSSRLVELVTTYDAATLEGQRQAVFSLAIGKAKSNYDAVTGGGLLSVLQTQQATSKGKVDRASVETIGDDSATTLVLVTVTVTNKDLKTPRAQQNLIELSLVRTSSGWKVDDLTILGQLTL